MTWLRQLWCGLWWAHPRMTANVVPGKGVQPVYLRCDEEWPWMRAQP